MGTSRKKLAATAALWFAIVTSLGLPLAHAALISRIYTFSDGSVLTASQLNTEFNNVVDGVNSITDANISTGAALDPAKISSTIAGGGITRNSSTGVLSVVADGSTVEFSGLTLRVKDLGITTAKLNASAVTTSKILDDAVTAPKIAAGAVTSSKILDGTINAVDIGTGSINTGHIIDSNITTAKIADLNVTTAKINDLGVTTGKINDLAVTTAKIAGANVTSAKIETDVNLNGNDVMENGRKLVVANSNQSDSEAILKGAVRADGTIDIGSADFTVSGPSPAGVFTVNFNTSFGATPACVVSSTEGKIAGTGTVATSSMQVITTDAAAARTSAYFTFICMGVR